MLGVCRLAAFAAAILIVTFPASALAASADLVCVALPASGAPNTDIDMDFQCTNNGPDIATALPSSADNLTGFVGGGPVSGVFNAPMNVGDSFVFRFTYHVGAATPGSLVVFANASISWDASSPPDPDGTNNRFPLVATITGTADLGITNAVLSLTNTAGTDTQYTITAGNLAGPDDAFFSWSDTLPAGTTFVSLSPSTGCTTPAVGANGTVNCSLTLAAGNLAPYTLLAKLDPALGAGSSLSNTATISSTGITDGNLANNSSTAISTVATSADLGVTKTGPATAFSNTDITYTISTVNNGPSDAQAVSLSDTLPSGTSLVSFNQTSGPVIGGALPAGGTQTFSLVLHVLSSVASGTLLTNTANVSSTTTDTSPGNNSATQNTSISASSDLAVTKSAPASIIAGGNITYTIGLSNAGPSDATNVTLSDTLPPGTTMVSYSGAAGFGCVAPAVGTSGTLTCSNGSFASGASGVFSLTVATTAGMAGTTVSNTATVSTTASDSNSANNTATASTAVGGVTTFSAPSATGSGTISVVLSGGGGGCGFGTAQMIPVFGGPNSPNSAPGGVDFPHGLFDFTLTGCTPASTVTLTITYPSALPAGTSYYKYGPTAGIVTPHWYTLPATIVGAVVTFTITDGGLGDDDLAANGTIVDQGGPGNPGPPGSATAIPTLSEWTLILLGLLLLASGAVAVRNRERQRVRR